MKTLIRFCVCVLVIVSFCSSLYAQDAEKAWDYFNNEQYELAAKEFELTIIDAENEFGKDSTYAQLCLLTGMCYEKLYDVEQAIYYYGLCYDTYRSFPNWETESIYIFCLDILAQLYESIEEYEKALPLYLENLELIEKYVGKEHPSYGMAINDLAVLYRSMEQYNKALPLYIEALENAEQVLGKEHPNYGIRLNNLAELYQSMGEYEKALPLYLEAQEITKLALGKKHPEYGRSLNNIAMLYKSMGQYEKALSLSLEALEITKQALGKEHPDYGTRLNNLAVLYTSMGLYEKALPLLLEAIENTGRTLGKEHSDYAVRLNNLASLYRSMGQYDKALPLLLESKKIIEQTLGKTHSYYGNCLNNLAELYSSMGQYEKALPLFLEALENTEQALGKEHLFYSTNLNNLAILYKSIGQYDKALPLYLEALEITEQALGKEHSYYGTRLNNLALLYSSMGQYEKALPLFLEALENTGQTLGKEHSYYGSRLNNLAELYSSMGEYEKVLPLYLDALENAEQALGKEHPDYGLYLNNLAGLYRSKGEYEKALPLFLKALENAERTLGKDHADYATYLSNLAVLYESEGQYEKALPLYEEVIANINHNINQNFAFLSENEKEAYLKTVAYYFEKFNSFALQHKIEVSDITTDVYNNTLTNKGVLLKSSTAMRSAVLGSGDIALINKFEEWQSLNRQIARLYSTPKNKRFQDPKKLEEEATLVERELVSGSQEFNNYKKLQNIGWQDVQKTLAPNEASIEFISFEFYDNGWTDSTLYCALVLKNNSQYPEMIPLFEEKQLENYIRNAKAGSDASLITKLYGEKRGVKTLNTNASVSYADSLYSLIWKPVDSLLEGVETVYYSPSGLLHNISFSAIPYNDSLLVSAKYNLVYVSSSGRITNPQSGDIDFGSARVALYGGLMYETTGESGSMYSDSSRGGSWNYLKETLVESENIEQLLKDKKVSTTLYQGTEGNEESFKALAGNNSPEIIHLATHGFFFPDPEKEKYANETFFAEEQMVFKDSDNPLIRSGIIMSGANPAWSGQEIPDGIDDGILTAYEVSGLDLFNTQLVVLSACETGLGDIQGSEGVYGLQRSYKMAGVDYLIMSLWQVPDKETSEFMTLFYTHLLNTTNIRKAFAETQKTMRQAYDPYYWAAFVLIE
jgi:tetratricopeptide (TPR) repeat protein